MNLGLNSNNREPWVRCLVRHTAKRKRQKYFEKVKLETIFFIFAILTGDAQARPCPRIAYNHFKTNAAITLSLTLSGH